jgi:UDP-3-O-[3-hydroxymyristoyl] glucosamine N-acyltransferase
LRARRHHQTRLVARVTLIGDVSIGRRGLLHPGVVLGADGFGLAPDKDGWVKVPQIGGVRVGDDVEIGANTTVDRGAIGDTVLGNGVKLDNQIQVGHNVSIGAGTAVAAQTGISGSTTIGRGCLIAGKVGIAGHIDICDGVVVLGNSSVTNSIREVGTYASMIPIDEAGRWRRTVARLNRLDELYKRVRRLEKGARTEESDVDDPQ